MKSWSPWFATRARKRKMDPIMRVADAQYQAMDQFYSQRPAELPMPNYMTWHEEKPRSLLWPFF